jgi:hypothetical protein
VHGCPRDRGERSGYESDCNVGVEGKCVSGGEKRESVGMWVAPIDPVKVEGEMGTGRSWLSVWWPVDPEERVPVWMMLARPAGQLVRKW